eukprot:6119474-Pleurochrysis_carterae.AAC.1
MCCCAPAVSSSRRASAPVDSSAFAQARGVRLCLRPCTASRICFAAPWPSLAPHRVLRHQLPCCLAVRASACSGFRIAAR